MSSAKPITDILSAPLERNWNIVELADKVLKSVAAHLAKTNEDVSIKWEDLKDRQSQRLIRPLLAHFAMKSAKENGTDPNIYEGDLLFKRQDDSGRAVIIRGNFINKAKRTNINLIRHFTSGQEDIGERKGDIVLFRAP